MKEVLVESFECLMQFLKSHNSNSLSIAEVQNLDGIGVINLAGSGSLYLKVSPKVGSDNPLASTSIRDITKLSTSNSHSGPSTPPSCTTSSTVQTHAGSSAAQSDATNSSNAVRETLKKADKFLIMIRVSYINFNWHVTTFKINGT